MVLVVGGALTADASGQGCQPGWTGEFSGGDLAPYARSFARFDDDGAGPRETGLYAAGKLTTAGGTAVSNVARWDHRQWESVGGGTNAEAFAAISFDEDGQGPQPMALFVGGDFTTAGGVPAAHVARWDGLAWTAVGPGLNGSVRALAAFDQDGPGPQSQVLFAAGMFTASGSLGLSRVAYWDGQDWHPAATGINGTVHALTTFDADGTGPGLPVLAAGGQFTQAGGLAAANLARWTGTAWSALGTGVNASVLALASFDADDDGPLPPALVAGGTFTNAGGVPASRIARWSQGSWSPFGLGLNDAVYTVEVFREPVTGTPRLIAGGLFTGSGPQSVSKLARWTGSSWVALGAGLGGFVSGPPPAVYGLGLYGDELSTDLYVSGNFGRAGSVGAAGIARWNSQAWFRLGHGAEGDVYDLAMHDEDGEGPSPVALFAGGRFDSAGGGPIVGVARYDGQSWTQVGPGPTDGYIETMLGVSEGPLGPRLFVGGEFSLPGVSGTTRIAQWDGQTWGALTTGVSSVPYDLCEFDVDGPGPGQPCLVVAGAFTEAGGAQVAGLARWSGAEWMPVQPFLDNPSALSLVVLDPDDSGPLPPRLYVGGYFTAAGTAQAMNIASWDGVGWAPLGSGLGGPVYALQVFDEDGPGGQPSRLFAGGNFSNSGPASVSCVARWDGALWSSVGTGLSDTVGDFSTFDPDGPGGVHARLVAAGLFTMAGSAPIPYLGAWDGTGWSSLAGGMNDFAFAVLGVHAPSPFATPTLFAGGRFSLAGAASAERVAAWRGCRAQPCYANCTGEVSLGGSPVLTVADFACFQSKFAAADPYADCNGDSDLTIADFGCFQAKFVAGCP